MRKWNAVISTIILAMFLFHAVSGSFQLFGLDLDCTVFIKKTARILLSLIIIHIVIGFVLTGKTFQAIRKSGASYFKENKLFWIKRISGFAMILFIMFHVFIFMGKNDGAFRLHFFGVLQLASQLLVVISLAIHVVTNIKPLMLALGAKSYKNSLTDLILILSLLLLLMGISFVIYYLRWNIF